MDRGIKPNRKDKQPVETISHLPAFDELYQAADQLVQPVGVAVAGGADPTVLEALAIASRRGWVKPIICGDQSRILDLAGELQIDPAPFTIINSETPAHHAVEQIHSGNARLLMKGQVATPELMKAVLNKETGLRTGRVICQMVLMEIPRDQKTFLMTDTGITVAPNLDQKRDLLNHLVQTAKLLGCTFPKIAIMSATEKVNPSLPDTLDAEKLTKQATAGQFEDCLIDGPLSFDLAYAQTAGSRKQLDSQVIGQADGMLFPDILSANLTVKALMYAADSRFGGILCGTSAPVVFMSRADDVATRLNSLAYTLKILEARNS